MLILLGWFLAAVLALAVAVALTRGSWWVSAVFGAWLFTVLLVNFGDGSEAWLRFRWVPAETVALLVTLLAVGGAIVRETSSIDSLRRSWLIFGASVTSLSIVGLIWIDVHHGDWLWTFIDAQARAWQWAALTLGIVVSLIPHRATRDSFLLLAVAATHAIIGPMVHVAWIPSQEVFRALTVVACCWWMRSPRASDSLPFVRT